MKIISIKIDEFGCLSDKSYELSDGFNLAVGENESGKSTLLAFIKFIFYGLPKKTLETSAERDRSFGWKSNTAGGSLTFSDGEGKIFTVYRKAVRKKGEKREAVTEECRIIDEQSGTQVHKDESPADIFIGVPSPVFESTCFVRQMGMTDVSTTDVGSALENILLSADESINLEKALERLEGARKLLLHKKGSGGLLYELEAERDNLSSRLDKAKLNYEKILAVTEDADSLRKDATKKRQELTRLEELEAAVGKASAVKRFDALHEKEKELADSEAILKDFRKASAHSSGFIPDMAYVGTLREALKSINETAEEYAEAEKALAAAESVLDKEQNDIVSSSPLSPGDIRMRGGIDHICTRLRDGIAAANKKKKTGSALLAVFGASLAAAVCLAALSFPLAVTPLLYAGIGAAALSAIFAVAGASSRSASKRMTEKTDAEIKALGAPSKEGLSFEDRIDMIKKSLLICLEREERVKELEARYDTAKSVALLRKKDLDSAESRARSLIEKWKPVPYEDTVRSLSGIIKEAGDVIDRSELICRDIISLRGQAQTLRDGLVGINEAETRAKVPAIAMKIYEEGKENEIIRSRKFCAEALRAINERAHETDMALVRLENESENPARLAVALEENRKRFDREKLRFDAIMMASEALSEASNDIRSSVSPILRSKAEGYMATLTDKKYVNLGIDESYAVSARSENDGVRPIELLSAGTKDSAYLSLRLALLEVIFRDDRPFLALDEALAQLDDKRASAALRILASYCTSGGQCILFTCHSREEKLLDNIAKVNVINL